MKKNKLDIYVCNRAFCLFLFLRKSSLILDVFLTKRHKFLHHCSCTQTNLQTHRIVTGSVAVLDE